MITRFSTRQTPNLIYGTNPIRSIMIDITVLPKARWVW